MLKKLIAAVVVLVVVAVGAVWFFVLKDDPEKQLSVDDPASGSTTTAVDTGQAVDVAGAWTVQAGGDTAVGFRIQETFIGGVAKHTAVGRTASVTGGMTIAGTQVTKADI